GRPYLPVNHWRTSGWVGASASMSSGNSASVLYSQMHPSMKVRFLCLFFILSVLSSLHAQPEFRGAWVSTVFNIDWPSKAGLPAAQQQAELRAILDRVQQLKMNAILLQVRSMSDACYASKREPWSEFLTGKQGRDPGYDPLAFAIGEAHARGIE